MNINDHGYYTAVAESMVTYEAEKIQKCLNPTNTNTGVNFTEKNLSQCNFSSTAVKKIELSTRAGDIHIKKSDDANLIVIMCEGKKPTLSARKIELDTDNSSIVVCLPSSNNTNSIPELDLYTRKGDIKTDGTYRLQSAAFLTIQRGRDSKSLICYNFIFWYIHGYHKSFLSFLQKH